METMRVQVDLLQAQGLFIKELGQKIDRLAGVVGTLAGNIADHQDQIVEMRDCLPAAAELANLQPPILSRLA